MPDEDDLRAALGTLAQHAPDADRMLLAVRSAAGKTGTKGRPPYRRYRTARVTGQWSRRIVPLAAAAAVIAVVAGLLATAAVGRFGGSTPLRLPPGARQSFTADGLPAYFLEAPGCCTGAEPNGSNYGGSPPPRSLRSHSTLRIISTATGQVAATVPVPGYAYALAASRAAYFAAVVRGNAATFYEIRLAPDRTHATATLLPIPPDTAPIGSITASPDGSRLAIATLVDHKLSYGAASDIQNLVVAITATGAERQWTTPARDAQGSMNGMTWLADSKTLAIGWIGAAQDSPSSTMHLLDTTAPGGSLLSGPAVGPNLVNRAGLFSDYAISPDGKVLFGIVQCVGQCTGGNNAGIVGRQRVALGSVIEFSAAGRPRVLYTEPMLPGVRHRGPNRPCNDPLWIGPTGSKVLLACYQYRPAAPGRKAELVTHVLLLTNGRVSQQLPWLAPIADQTVTVAFPGMDDATVAGLPPFGCQIHGRWQLSCP